MNADFLKRFLTNTDDTGRFIVNSQRTGKRYFVEPIDGRSKTDWTEWGSIDPATGKMMNKPGFRKYAGAIQPQDSMIDEANGFSKVHFLEPGMSPLYYIDILDEQYPDKAA
jgi:hypothetical protein